ncbi:transcriptional regulator with XRE-family HTH domain [Rhizobium azooxidifex]|uniref:Transcriptional regulator with XRE-family HTH domain n=1 Tax=Mycoplana azooxidifex TaxID=1636188 RepID=A0A7W6DB73_9HYPH|nr:hypothetical protein [Mycoplana azooxidifex]MBB3979344.1 transcriptional regulator with XRE-family HTH domain [Mycoplana azooxidifex]
MIPNSENWQYMGHAIRTRMQELELTRDDVMRGAGLPNRTIVTSLMQGRARLELKFVAGLARVLQINEHQLMLSAMQGFLSQDDVEFLKPFLPSADEIALMESLREDGAQSIAAAIKTLSQVDVILKKRR